MASSVASATRAKMTRIVNLGCDLNIIIDTHTSVEDVEKIFLNHKLKWKLSQFKHIRTYAKNKGIIVFYKHNVVKIKDSKIIQAGQLVSFQAKKQIMTG